MRETRWGSDEIVWHGDYAVKKLTMRKGRCCSLHYHERKHETITVLSGELIIVAYGTVQVLSAGDSMTIPPGPDHAHRMLAVTGDAIYIESSNGLFSDDDKRIHI
jgi:quercetin dioxygenase-like cupin family protein